MRGLLQKGRGLFSGKGTAHLEQEDLKATTGSEDREWEGALVGRTSSVDTCRLKGAWHS